MLLAWRQPLSPERFSAVVGVVATITAIITATVVGSGAFSSAKAAPVVPLVDVPASIAATASAPSANEAVAFAVTEQTVASTASPTTTAAVDIAGGAAVVANGSAVLTSPSPTWARSGNSQCRCSVEFPWPATATSTAVESGTTQLMLAEHRSSPLSAALWTAPAPDGGATVADLEALLTSVAGNEGTIADQATSTRTDGSPVVTASLKDGAALSRVQVFSVGTVSYVMLMGASDGQLANDSYNRFVNSFVAQ